MDCHQNFPFDHMIRSSHKFFNGNEEHKTVLEKLFRNDIGRVRMEQLTLEKRSRAVIFSKEIKSFYVNKKRKRVMSYVRTTRRRLYSFNCLIRMLLSCIIVQMKCIWKRMRVKIYFVLYWSDLEFAPQWSPIQVL